jgi:hypothetical protein
VHVRIATAVTDDRARAYFPTSELQIIRETVKYARIAVCLIALTAIVDRASAYTAESPSSRDSVNVGEDPFVETAAPHPLLHAVRSVLPELREDDRYLTTFVGEFAYRWPYRSISVYRPIPAWRYNRVDGLVLGIRQKPIEWDAYERLGLYGQVGYAFALERVQYEIGAEGRLGQPYGEEDFDLKVGAAYRHLTSTDDLWKSGWAENTLAAFFFNYDAFDYYHTEGWTAYAAARLGQYAMVTAGFRSDDYESLGGEADWSLFGGDNFRFNPPADEGRMQSVVLAVEGGSVSRFHSLPSGAVFRIEAEIGDGLGGDFSFNRVLGDGRAYIRTGRTTSLAMRLRGGLVGGTVPVQKAFTLGGLGSVRGYPQNAFLGERMLLGNVEYAIADVRPFGNVLKDLQLAAFFDAGWVGRPDESFRVDDVFSSVGVGVGFFDRRLRLDLAFPLSDLGGSRDPSLWLRLLPAF